MSFPELLLRRRRFLTLAVVSCAGAGLIAYRFDSNSYTRTIDTIFKENLGPYQIPKSDFDRFCLDFKAKEYGLKSGARARAFAALSPLFSVDVGTQFEELHRKLLKVKTRVLNCFLLSSDFFRPLGASQENATTKEIRYLGWHTDAACSNPFANFSFDDESPTEIKPTLSPQERIYRERGCDACHGADREGGLGPSLKGLAGTKAILIGGEELTRDRAYLERAILEPQAEIVEGFKVAMPSYASTLSKAELDAIVDFLMEVPEFAR